MLEVYQKKKKKRKKKIKKLHEVSSWPIVGLNFLLEVMLKNPSLFKPLVGYFLLAQFLALW